MSEESFEYPASDCSEKLLGESPCLHTPSDALYHPCLWIGVGGLRPRLSSSSELSELSDDVALGRLDSTLSDSVS